MDFIFHFIIKTRFLPAFIDFSLLEVEILFLFYWWLSLSSQIDTKPSNDEVKSKLTCNCLTVGIRNLGSQKSDLKGWSL